MFQNRCVSILRLRYSRERACQKFVAFSSNLQNAGVGVQAEGWKAMCESKWGRAPPPKEMSMQELEETLRLVRRALRLPASTQVFEKKRLLSSFKCRF